MFLTFSNTKKGEGTCIEYTTKYKDITLCEDCASERSKDIQPTILLTIKGLLIKDSLVDSGIRIG